MPSPRPGRGVFRPGQRVAMDCGMLSAIFPGERKSIQTCLPSVIQMTWCSRRKYVRQTCWVKRKDVTRQKLPAISALMMFDFLIKRIATPSLSTHTHTHSHHTHTHPPTIHPPTTHTPHTPHTHKSGGSTKSWSFFLYSRFAIIITFLTVGTFNEYIHPSVIQWLYTLTQTKPIVSSQWSWSTSHIHAMALER